MLAWLKLFAGGKLGRLPSLALKFTARSECLAVSKTGTNCFWSRSTSSTHRETKPSVTACFHIGFDPTNSLPVNCSVSTRAPDLSPGVPSLPSVFFVIPRLLDCRGNLSSQAFF